MMQKNNPIPAIETEAVFAWKDPQHTHRFQELVQSLLSRFFCHGVLEHIPETDIPLLARIATLHDIGKLWLPPEIINKSGSLTPEETAIMKKHTLWGASFAEQALQGQEETPVYTYFREICRHHHERWDGNGYPDGLKGDAIPRYVQAVSLVDAYDALRTARPYRPALPHQDAVKLIRSGDCGAFAPKMLDYFCSIIDNADKELYAENDTSQ